MNTPPDHPNRDDTTFSALTPHDQITGLIGGCAYKGHDRALSGDVQLRRSGRLARSVREDGLLRGSVGSEPRRGRDGLTTFWDEIHPAKAPEIQRSVRMVQGPAVCGLEAAWAFELRIARGDSSAVVEIIDQASFSEAGRLRHLRAFWSEATIRVE